MKLINKTKDVVLAEELRKPTSLKEKSIGLIGNEEPEAIYFQTRWGLHTFGMSFPIDCLVCDDDMVIRKLRKRLKPGRFFIWNPKYKNIIELPADTITDTKTQVLDKLEIVED